MALKTYSVMIEDCECLLVVMSALPDDTTGIGTNTNTSYHIRYIAFFKWSCLRHWDTRVILWCLSQPAELVTCRRLPCFTDESVGTWSSTFTHCVTWTFGICFPKYPLMVQLDEMLPQLTPLIQLLDW